MSQVGPENSSIREQLAEKIKQRDLAYKTYKEQRREFEDGFTGIENVKVEKDKFDQLNREIYQLKQQCKIPLLNIPETEWEQAEAFFNKAGNENETKLPRPKSGRVVSARQQEFNTNLSHSFICVEDPAGEKCIYAKKTGECIGEGNFGKVKICQTRDGENFAIKIEGGGKQLSDEEKIMAVAGKFKGRAIREFELGQEREFKGAIVSQKTYTAMELEEGDELFNSLYYDKNAEHRVYGENQLNELQKTIIAIKCMESIAALHDKGIIHADIKPENFMANINGQMIAIAAIDFGFSMQLKGNEETITKYDKLGSPMFMAPEILRQSPSVYSKESDIYALGMMFQADLELNLPIVNKMMNRAPNNRPNSKKILSALFKKLESMPNLDPKTQEMIVDWKRVSNPNFGRPLPPPPRTEPEVKVANPNAGRPLPPPPKTEPEVKVANPNAGRPLPSPPPKAEQADKSSRFVGGLVNYFEKEIEGQTPDSEKSAENQEEKENKPEPSSRRGSSKR